MVVCVLAIWVFFMLQMGLEYSNRKVGSVNSVSYHYNYSYSTVNVCLTKIYKFFHVGTQVTCSKVYL